MAADNPDHSAQRLRRRGIRLAVLFLVFALGALGVGAWQLARSQSNARKQLRANYDNRATTVAGVLQSLFQAAFQQGAVATAKQFGGAVSPAALKAYARQSQVMFTAIIRPDGSVVAATPGTPAGFGKDLLPTALKKGIAISDLTTVAGQPALESAIAFKGTNGLRVEVSASPEKLFYLFLSGSLSRQVPAKGDSAYVLDAHGKVLGAASQANAKHPESPAPSLVRAVQSGKKKGFYDQRGAQRYFSSANNVLPGTNWHVAISTPTSTLYKTASGTTRWLPWVILGVLALALLAIGLLMQRAIEASARIAVVNAQLAASQERLRERAIELQRSNEELQRSNADLEQFAYVASHDLSAPLRAVAGFSQLLGVRYKGKLGDDADEFIKHMQDGVARMQGIIDDLLAYSRVDRTDLEPEPIDLDAILDEVLHSLGPDIAERGAEVTRDPLGRAQGEPGQLSQVVQNLIANGIKFTADGVTPKVHVSAERSGGRVRVSVRDNGIGIDAEHAERIFKMFQRLHTSDEYPGTGIGLAISQKIVERHGGSIVMEPAPGGGTVFTFDIPAESGS
jgi:signal transduction histidine kinase